MSIKETRKNAFDAGNININLVCSVTDILFFKLDGPARYSWNNKK